MRKVLAVSWVTPAVLVVVALIAGAIESPYFLDIGYLLDASTLYVEAGLLALGMTLVIVCGQIDLSVASMLALTSVVFARLTSSGTSLWLAIALCVLFGLVLGTVNGLLVGRMKLPSFVVTLATMAAYRGIAQVMLGADSQAMPAALKGLDAARIGGVPWMLVILLVFAAAAAIVLHGTLLGRWIFATGTNARAAYASGVPTGWVVVTVFAITGGLAALAGMSIDSRLGVARFDHATGLELDVITAVVLGGASIFGGKGTILGTMLALLLLALVRTGMGLANVTAEYQLAVVGALLIVAVLIGSWTARRPAAS